MDSNATKNYRDAEDQTDYDPYLHREVKKPVSDWDTYVHFIKGSIGTGILAMPQSYKNSGWINGPISTVWISIITTYCLHILFRTEYAICKHLKKPYLSYAECMKISAENGPECLRKISTWLGYAVDVCLISYQIGVMCVYILFVAVNIKDVWDNTMEQNVKIELLLSLLFLPFLLIMFVPNLKYLSPFGTVANVAVIVSFILLFYYLFQDLPNLIENRPKFADIARYPLFVGTTMFAVLTIGVYTALESKMETPRSFVKPFGILNVGMFITVAIFIFVGFMGFWKYGEKTEPTITLNIPSNEPLAQSVKIIYSISLYVSFGLHGFVPLDILWSNYIKKRLDKKEGQNLLAWEYLVRFLMVLIVVLLAIAIPFLGHVISFLGTFMIAALGFIFPPIMEICWKYPDKLGNYKCVIIRNCIIMIIGLIGIITGTFCCVKGIVEEYNK